MLCVTVAMKAMQEIVDIGFKAAKETDGFKDALLDTGRKILTGSRNSDMQQRKQVFECAVIRATQ